MRLALHNANQSRRKQSGSILGVSAVAILAILGVVALGIDVSRMYLVAAELQNAADAAALAGASALNGGKGGIDNAVTRATEAMNRYEFNKVATGLAAANITFLDLATFQSNGNGLTAGNVTDTAAKDIGFVKVTIPAKTISTVVAKAFMQSFSATPVADFTISRSAVAGKSVGINTVCNFVPFAILQDGVSNLNLAPGTTCSNKTTFTKDCVYTAKLSSGTGNGNGNGNQNTGPTAGDFVILSLPSSRSGDASDVRRLMAIGTDVCATAGVTTVSQFNGAKVGQVKQGLNTRFDDYNGAGMNATDFPPDSNIKSNITYGEYKSGLPAKSQAPSSPGLPDRRVLILPILNVVTFNNNSGTNVTIDKFGAFFMREPVSGNTDAMTLEYIGVDIVIGNGGFVIGGGHIDGLTVPVLYR